VQNDLAARAAQNGDRPASLKPVAEASAQLTASAARAAFSLRTAGAASLNPAKAKEINRALVSVEQALLAQEGLAGRPWFKHTIYAPGSYAGYAAETMPGVSESLDRNDPATLRIEADSLAAALRRAATRLDDVSRLARGGEPQPAAGH
jgi:N-acetylated-alpha-linked acidic dipeptidase